MGEVLQRNGRTSGTLTQSPPRYQVIANQLQQQRERITEPEKLPSEEALATEHHVARDTVRRAMEILEKRGAVTRHRGRGTFLLPEEAVPTAQSGLGVGFIPPWWADSMQASYTSSVFGGICGWADEQDWHLSVCHVPRLGMTLEELLQKVSARRLDGLIWVQPVPEQHDLLKAVAERVPCVVIGREYTDHGIHAVSPDYNAAVAMIDEHLVANGHSHYAVLGRDTFGPYADSWLKALQEVHKKRGSVFAYWDHFVPVRPFDRDRLADLLLDFYCDVHHTLQAMVLTSSSYLVPLLDSERFRKLVPEQMSLVAFDYGIQRMESYWTGHQITHVACDWPRIGRRAVDVLSRLMDGQTEVPEVFYEPVCLVEGETVSQYQPEKAE